MWSDLWDVKRKPSPRSKWYICLWRNPPSEVIIIYDEFSAPSADDCLIDANYFGKTTYKLIQPRANTPEVDPTLPK